jgi:hypothetical protein
MSVTSSTSEYAAIAGLIGLSQAQEQVRACWGFAGAGKVRCLGEAPAPIPVCSPHPTLPPASTPSPSATP